MWAYSLAGLPQEMYRDSDLTREETISFINEPVIKKVDQRLGCVYLALGLDIEQAQKNRTTQTIFGCGAST